MTAPEQVYENIAFWDGRERWVDVSCIESGQLMIMCESNGAILDPCARILKTNPKPQPHIMRYRCCDSLIGWIDDPWVNCWQCGMPCYLFREDIEDSHDSENILILPATPLTLNSPIEKRFWAAYVNTGLWVGSLSDLVSQWELFGGRYRLDFALPRLKIGIELDGYEYHSSKEAFTRDRERHRQIEAAGWRIIRFSGSEVVANADACVRETARLINTFREQERLHHKDIYECGRLSAILDEIKRRTGWGMAAAWGHLYRRDYAAVQRCIEQAAEFEVSRA